MNLKQPLNSCSFLPQYDSSPPITSGLYSTHFSARNTSDHLVYWNGSCAGAEQCAMFLNASNSTTTKKATFVSRKKLSMFSHLFFSVLQYQQFYFLQWQTTFVLKQQKMEFTEKWLFINQQKPKTQKDTI